MTLVFDGQCGLCHGAVRFIAARDPHRYFRFASADSPAGRRILQAAGVDTVAPDTMVLLQEASGPLLRSDAALAVCRHLTWPWPILAACARCIPRPLRDAIYRRIATHRHALAGPPHCPLPDSIQDRIIEPDRQPCNTPSGPTHDPNAPERKHNPKVP